MKQKLQLTLLLCAIALFSNAQNVVYDSLYVAGSDEQDSLIVLKYTTSSTTIGSNLATINVPKGFKYLDGTQGRIVLEYFWGNMPDPDLMGLILPLNYTPLDKECWAVSINYDNSGHVEDDDAKDINYDELLAEMQKDIQESNKKRTSQGYQAVTLTGWAVTPYYDSQAKKLHWAKKVKFDGDSIETLNYNIRVLGRSGVLQLNVIAGMNQFGQVYKHVDPLISSVSFNEGQRYENFDSGVDKVAAYGIGGLIAGKVLAKAGFFVLLLKFWKIILLAIVGGFAAVKKFFFGKKPKEETTPNDTTPTTPDEEVTPS